MVSWIEDDETSALARAIDQAEKLAEEGRGQEACELLANFIVPALEATARAQGAAIPHAPLTLDQEGRRQ